jgi:hypothetical protein
MRKLQRAAMLTAVVALIGSMPALPLHASPVDQAGQSPTAREGQGQTAREPVAVVGELTRVNPDAKTIGVKTANGAEMMFNYTDMTTVVGAEKNIAGLATLSGAQVTVNYRVEGSSNIATSIEVRNKS